MATSNSSNVILLPSKPAGISNCDLLTITCVKHEYVNDGVTSKLFTGIMLEQSNTLNLIELPYSFEVRGNQFNLTKNNSTFTFNLEQTGKTLAEIETIFADCSCCADFEGVNVGVTSVNNRTGAVTLTKGDVNLPNVDNTADNVKPVSTPQQNAINNAVAQRATRAITGMPANSNDMGTFSGDTFGDNLNIKQLFDATEIQLEQRHPLIEVYDDNVAVGIQPFDVLNFTGNVEVTQLANVMTVNVPASGTTVIALGDVNIEYQILTGTPVITSVKSVGVNTMTVTGGTIKLVRFDDIVQDSQRDSNNDFKWLLVGIGTNEAFAVPTSVSKRILNAANNIADASSNGTTSNQFDVDNTPAVKYGNIVTTGQGSIILRSNNIPTSGGAGNSFSFKW